CIPPLSAAPISCTRRQFNRDLRRMNRRGAFEQLM
ncbi:MAG: hypothetical protein ACI9S9_004727, partial [Planctomycetota bacterium]